jgi:hypothetical protein
MKSSKAFAIATAAALALGASAVFAASPGSVSHLSGTLSVKKADGSVRILSQKSEIQNGDTLSTERDSYAQLRFTDGGVVTMRPNTTVKIENVSFAEGKPKDDSFLYGLLKGGLRAVTGLVGRRSQDKYQISTSTATIGIRGTTLQAETGCTGPAGEVGVCVSVHDGEVAVITPEGERRAKAGEALMATAGKPPFTIPFDSVLQWTPPATFLMTLGRGAAVSKDKLECVVRAR